GVLFLAITPNLSGLAQTQPAAPRFYRVQIMRTNPGMSDEWQRFYQADILPVLKKNGVKQSVALTRSFGNVREYSISSPLESLAELDEPGVMQKALGQTANRLLSVRHGRYLADWRMLIVTARPDMGIPAPAGYVGKLAVQAITNITPGRVAEYEKGWKENVLPLSRKTNVKAVLVSKTLFGGDPNSFTALFVFDSWADLEKFQGQMAKATAELKLTAAPPAGVVAHTEWNIVRLMPEMSIMPEAGK
ncbi:MAG: hypothetical protein ACKV2V_12455, partial [Blastocatellia bacterium]